MQELAASFYRRRAVLPLLRVECSCHYQYCTGTLTVCASRFFDLLPSLQVFPIRNVIQVQGSREKLVYPSFCCSYSGWLLLSNYPSTSTRGHQPKKYTFFVHSPFRNETHELDLPTLEPEWRYQYREVEVAGFSTTPSSRDCVIFVLWKYRRYTYQVEWDVFFITTYNRKHQNQKHGSWMRKAFELPRYNPEKKGWEFIKDVAYVDGNFYCAVDMESKVVYGSFNVEHQKWDMMMDRSLKLPSRPEQMNFVKSDEMLLLAISYLEQGGDGFFYHIHQFDLSRKEWTRVKTLVNRVLMLCSCSSVATAAMGVISKLANMIFVRNLYSDRYLGFTWEMEIEGVCRYRANNRGYRLVRSTKNSSMRRE